MNNGGISDTPSEHLSPRSSELSDPPDVGSDGEETTPATSSSPDRHAPGRWMDWSEHQRLQIETTFVMQMNTPINGSWKNTEAYVKVKDAEMCEYISDFPAKEWALGKKLAVAAYKAMLDRDRLRNAGLSIFSRGIPVWWPVNEFRKDPLTQQYSTSNSASSVNSSAPLLVPPARTTHPPAPLIAPPPSANYSSIIHSDAAGQPSYMGLHSMPVYASEDAMVVSPALARLRLQQSTAPAFATSFNPRPMLRRDRQDDDQDDGFIPHPVLRDDPQMEDQDQDYMDMPPPPLPRVTRKPRAAHTSATDKSVSPTMVRKPNKSAADKKPFEERFEDSLGRLSRARTIDRDLTPPPYDRDTTQPRGSSLLEYPWQTVFAGEDSMVWDDTIYPESTLQSLDRAHKANAPRVAAYITRKGKKKGPKADSTADSTADSPADPKAKSKTGNRKLLRADEPKEEKLGLRLKFSTPNDQASCEALGYDDLSIAVDAGMRNPFHPQLAAIMVFNDPGDSLIEGLEVPIFSVLDASRTRLQLSIGRPWSSQAGYRLIDFCPDMLNGYKLLRLISETPPGNSAVQQRLGWNGSMISDSTITKRITASLDKAHDRVSASEAAARHPDFKVRNRGFYNKYTAYRQQRREQGHELPSTFDLAEAAARYVASRAGVVDGPAGVWPVVDVAGEVPVEEEAVVAAVGKGKKRARSSSVVSPVSVGRQGLRSSEGPAVKRRAVEEDEE